MDTGGAIYGVDPLVPRRYVCPEIVPESLRATALEVLDRHPLLLDPGVVAEIEHT